MYTSVWRLLNDTKNMQYFDTFRNWWSWSMINFFNPLPDEKMEESYPNGRDTMGKGEIAHYEQFLLFPQCFQKACFPGASKGVIVWEWVNMKCHIGRVPYVGLGSTHYTEECQRTFLKL